MEVLKGLLGLILIVTIVGWWRPATFGNRLPRKYFILSSIVLIMLISILPRGGTSSSQTTSGFHKKRIEEKQAVKSESSSNSEQERTESDSLSSEEKIIEEPKLGGPIENFKAKFGTPDSRYMDAIGYYQDDMLINSDGKYVKEISMSFVGETYLNKEQALKKITPYLPSDAHKIKSNSDEQHIEIIYKSEALANIFYEWYGENNGSGAGLILLSVFEGDPKSEYRNRDVTRVRLELTHKSLDKNYLNQS